MKTQLWILSLMAGLALSVQGLGQDNANPKPDTASPPSNQGDASAVQPATNDGNALKNSRKLMPNDVLAVRVVGEAELTVERRVANDGTITYPFLETLKIEGKTPSEVEQIIRDGLAKDYLVNPQVMVDVKDYVKQFFTVGGQVNREGQYEYPVDRKVDVLEAISMAAGFSKLAKKDKIEVRRGNETFRFSEKQLKESNDPDKKFYVQPNDKIMVEERIF